MLGRKTGFDYNNYVQLRLIKFVKKKKKKGMAQKGSSLNMVINEHKSKFF